MSEEKDEAKRGELKAVLGLSDEDASDLEEMVTSGKFKLAPTADAGGKASFF